MQPRRPSDFLPPLTSPEPVGGDEATCCRRKHDTRRRRETTAKLPVSRQKPTPLSSDRNHSKLTRLTPLAQQLALQSPALVVAEDDMRSPVECGKSYHQHEQVEVFSLKEQKPDKTSENEHATSSIGSSLSSGKTVSSRKCLRALFHTENAYEEEGCKSPPTALQRPPSQQEPPTTQGDLVSGSSSASPLLVVSNRESARDKKRRSPQNDLAHIVQPNGTSPSDDQLIIRKRWKRGLHQTRDSTRCRNRALSSSKHSDRLVLARSTSTPAISTAQSYLDSPYIPFLPTIPSRSHPDLNVISPQTVASVLNGDFDEVLASCTFIDCRFKYEHDGGTIHNAMLLTDPEEVERRFLHNPPANSKKRALIFFCEYSSKRAPQMIRHFRNLDRRLHDTCYPELFYPELYLIDGGYKNCFESFREVCAPQRYISMNDKGFLSELKSSYSLLHTQWKNHKGCACVTRFPSAVKDSPKQTSVTVRIEKDMASLPLLTLGRRCNSEQS